jgi:exodeoxyribonuclease VII large subunit
VRDVLSVLGRRFRLSAVEILPVPVQGREAPPALIAALQDAARLARHDVLLLTRGGGSLEDLWAFNDEALARAIAASPIPVISAVGHEVDFTIADFVADLRAPTPSAAAELLVPDVRDVEREVAAHRDRLALLWRRRLERAQQRLDQAATRLLALRPQHRLALGRTRLANLRLRLDAAQERRSDSGERTLAALRLRLHGTHPRRRIDGAKQALQRAALDLRRDMARHLEGRARHLGELARALNAVSPLATLGRGYAILFAADGDTVVRSVAQLQPGAAVRARLADGEVGLRVD